MNLKTALLHNFIRLVTYVYKDQKKQSKGQSFSDGSINKNCTRHNAESQWTGVKR